MDKEILWESSYKNYIYLLCLKLKMNLNRDEGDFHYLLD
jgi:hypothetical protein